MQRLLILFPFFLVLNACTHSNPPLVFPKPLREPLQEKITSQKDNTNLFELKTTSPESSKSDKQTTPQTRLQTAPALPKRISIVQNETSEVLPKFGDMQPIGLNVDNIPLPTFINEVFAKILKLTIQIDSKLKDKTDLVTLNIATPQSATELFRITRRVLNRYGVVLVRDTDTWFFTLGKNNKTRYTEPPLLVSGRTLPNVPTSHRSIFQFVPIHTVRLNSILPWLKNIYDNQNVELIPDFDRNTLILVGKSEELKRIVKVIEILDQPLMRGRNGIIIRPIYISAKTLSDNLTQALRSEGYGASNAVGNPDPIIILPFTESNTVLVFTVVQSVMKHIQEWVDKLDQPAQSANQHGFFFYAVKNTPADSIAEVVKQLLVTNKGAQPITKKPAQTTIASSALVVDEIRNALIFKGSNEAWAQLLPIIKKLDTPPKMVLIDMIIAEITLSNEVEFGIEWLLRNAGFGDSSGSLGTLVQSSGGGLGLSARGLNYFPISNSGQTLAALNAFSGSNRVSILSNPHIMVRSGEEAKIQVGSEVPIVTSSSTASDIQQNGTSSILQQIQYRSTGVSLTVKPTVYAGNRIDLEVSQEVSQAEINEVSNISSPIILKRSIQTKLSLEDGGSVLLGGLISNNSSDNLSGIPLLSDIPILGNLFKVEKDRNVRTELLMIILPYVIHDQHAAESLTQNWQQRLQLLEPLQSITKEKGVKRTQETTSDKDLNHAQDLAKEWQIQLSAEPNH